ncbi:MAG: hypothetical protein JRJ19_13745 [Deltaproteobacteria bacterium]|nr:hypothetical protein [Deltaproteobacteria bacterium]MBW1873127.1 hypothetical protein [Deltaproteobacteria bacterium]
MPRKKKTVKKVAKKEKKGKRYSSKQRVATLSKYNTLRATGLTAMQAAKKVGVSYLTLLKWEKISGRKPGQPKKSGRKPVKQASVTVKKGQLVLITPAGFRIEGISAKDLIQVLKAVK